MPRRYRIATAAVAAVMTVWACLWALAQDNPPPAATATKFQVRFTAPDGDTREPTVTVLDKHEVQGIVGREVRSAADENMGRIVDVIVDVAGQVRAAIIDFGGFLGVGSRKIAVAWDALRFKPTAGKGERITLELTRDQVRAAPEYKDDKPVIVLGAWGSLESLPYR